MDGAQKNYYREMIKRERGFVILKDGHVAAIVTYLIGDDDKKYLFDRTPWELIDDEPQGKTVYVDQLLIKDHAAQGCMHEEFSNFLTHVKEQFPQVVRAKWIRIGAMFRKHGIKEGVKSYVHCKNIT